MAGILTFDDLAAHLRISPSTLRRLMAKTPGLTYLKVGRSRMFRPADVERFMEALAASTSPSRVVTAKRETRVISARSAKRTGETAREAIARKTQKPPRDGNSRGLG